MIKHSVLKWKMMDNESVSCDTEIVGVGRIMEILNNKGTLLDKFDERLFLVFNESKPKWMPVFLWKWLLNQVLSVKFRVTNED